MASSTGGVKPFSLQGRLYRERERLIGMTAEERAWRAQWIKDQHLAKHEPVPVPELYNELYNPIRRFYRKPMDLFANALAPKLGMETAQLVRNITSRLFMGAVLVYAAAYYFKYNANDWTRKGGWRKMTSRPAIVPGDPGYPAVSDRSLPSDYSNRGFKNSPL